MLVLNLSLTNQQYKTKFLVKLRSHLVENSFSNKMIFIESTK